MPKTALDRHDPKLLVMHLDGWLRPHAPEGFWMHMPLPGAKIAICATPGRARRHGLEPVRQIFAGVMAEQLNRHIGNDGIWCVGWTDWCWQPSFGDGIGAGSVQPRRLLLPWFDRDLDMPVLVDCDDPFFKIQASTDSLVQQCAEALIRLTKQLQDHDVTERDMIKATLGQGSADPRAINPVMPIN